jgi:purine-nucleoside phosphorylase
MIRLTERVRAARDSIPNNEIGEVEIGLVLGSGLGDLLSEISIEASVPYAQITGFPRSTAPGHKGNLLIGELCGRRLAVFQGRFHLYEGYDVREIALPIYLLKALGARTLIVTNAAGALTPKFKPGVAMLIEDHLNFTGHNPLIGKVDDVSGPRFPDMSRAYTPALQSRVKSAAHAIDEPLYSGVYAAVTGPSLETSAERRFLRSAGAHAVGMSTVIEVIAANYCGLSVLGLSAITNDASGGADQRPDTIDEVLHQAGIAGKSISKLIQQVLPDM